MRSACSFRWHLSSVLVLILILPGFSQTIAPRFETLDVENGLSQNSVYRIFQDRIGFIWFGTADGLNRYDGNTIRVFKYTAPSIAFANSNTVRGLLLEDQQGRIWYANETGIYFYNPVTEKIEQAYDFLTKQGSGFVYYSALALDEQGDFWLLDPGRGVIRFSIYTKLVETFKYPSSIRPGEYALDPQSGKRYFYLQVPNRNGVLRFDKNAHTYDWIFEDLPNVNVVAESTQLFVSKNESLFFYDSTNHRLEPIPIQTISTISYAQQDAFGRYWVATRGDGLHVIDRGKPWVFRNDRSKLKTLPSNFVTRLFIDADQNLWIGMDGGGVSRLDLRPPRFNIFSLSDGDPVMKDYFIRCFYEDDHGRIWFGTLQDGFFIFDPQNKRIKKYSSENGLPGNSVGSIFRDRKGQVWIGYNQGISRFDEATGKFYPVPMEHAQYFNRDDNYVTQIIELPSGELLLSCYYGIYKIEQDKEGRYRCTNWKEFTSRAVGIIQTPDGHYWVASQVQGLYHVYPEEPRTLDTRVFFSRINLKSIHQDEQNPQLLWLSSGAGLIRFDTQTGSYKLYDEQAGIPGSFVYGLLEAADHNFWLSTNSGLCFFDRKNETFQHFTVADGLQSNEFNSGAFYKGPSGTLYFGGIKGFNWFSTGAERPTRTPPRSRVTSVQVNEVVVSHDSTFYFTRSLARPHHQNDYVFEFAVFNYTHPEANKVQYMLTGWDQNWITTDQKVARYSNLSPGSYHFKVRASTGNSAWGPEDQVSILIRSPFWRTAWFYGICSLIVLGMLGAGTRFIAHRKVEKKIRELEMQRAVWEERERISKDIHDDLGTGLSKISILSELAKQSKSADDFTQRQLEKISDSSHELIDNLGELIWSHNPANDSLMKLFWYIREHLSPVFDGTTTVLQLSLPDLTTDRSVPAAWRRNVFLAVKESLHNVLKHAQASRVELDFKVHDQHLHIYITDNGGGFDPSRTTPGNGLINIRKRMADCGGSVSIESQLGAGTQIHLIVPL